MDLIIICNKIINFKIKIENILQDIYFETNYINISMLNMMQNILI